MSGTVIPLLVRSISTVVISITSPQPGDAFSVSANKLIRIISADAGFTGISRVGGDLGLVDTLLAIIDSLQSVGTLAEGGAVWAGMA